MIEVGDRLEQNYAEQVFCTQIGYSKANTILQDSICLKSAYLSVYLYRLYNTLAPKDTKVMHL